MKKLLKLILSIAALALISANTLAAEVSPTLRNIAYGDDSAQRCDVYQPQQAKQAPIVLMVHGGGWAFGDKGNDNSIDNKAARWVPKGLIVVSCNYRMVPTAMPVTQAEDIAKALAMVQSKAAEWGGDRSKVILMGHSAGAHLVAMVAASPNMRGQFNAAAPIGTVSLDSGAYDVGAIMRSRHFGLYDRAFGKDESYWRQASPYYVLNSAIQPFLAVCSTKRMESCPQARNFTDKARSFGSRAEVLDEDLSHMEINQQLGLPGTYTDTVEAFMASLDPTVARLLGR